MNRKIIVYTVSRTMLFCACLMLLPIGVALIYGEDFKNIVSFLATMVLVALVFLPHGLKKPEDDSLYVKEGLIITSLIWLLMSFFGGLPYFLSDSVTNLVDAIFEAASGFTTTGATIITDVESIDKSILFWRSFTHYIGGMGVLVLAIAILPEVAMSSVQMMRAEMPGPQFGKLMPRLRSTARVLYMIYFLMTIVLIISLNLAGMPFFDSVVNAFSAAGTGGFSITNESIASYNSVAIELILAFGMMAFSINFNIYYWILIGRARSALASEELRVFVLIIIVSCLLIGINIYPLYDSILTCIKDAFFTVVTIMSTTGFATVNFDLWPTFSKVIILLLMFVGGCAGSTAGGLKVSRIIILAKASKYQLNKVLQPNRIQAVRFEGKSMERSEVEAIKAYFVIYMGLVFLFIALFALIDHSFEESFSAVLTSINNVGPGFETIGPKLTYINIPDTSKLLLAFVMIVGRLEIFPVLVLFMPFTWRNT